MISNDEDREATEFAAHLLVPSDFLAAEIEKLPRDLSPEDVLTRLAKTFKVSESLMAGRLAQEGFLIP